MIFRALISNEGAGPALERTLAWTQGRARAIRRSGFTLLELLLVLAVLILVAALSLPSLEAWYQGHRLQQGLDQVREHWIKGRTQAMEEGRPYRFGYTLNGGVYRLAPDYVENWPEFEGVAAGPLESAVGQPEGLIVEDQLPQGVVFYDWEGSQPGLGQGNSAWSRDSIVFWPDGTARLAGADGQERSQTFVIIRDRTGRAKQLHLRALTGVVSERPVQ
jgi:prepilin-type N-terminal cleavage/methylation domain-containing protein